MLWALVCGGTLAVALRLGVGYLNYHNAQVLNESHTRVEQTLSIFNQTEAITQNLDDIEMSVRLYMASGGQAYLKNYSDAVRAIDEHQQTMLELTTDNPSQHQLTIQVRRDFDQLMLDLRDQLADYQSHRAGFTFPQDEFNQVRLQVKTIEQVESSLLTQQSRQNSVNSQRSLRNTVILTGVSAFIVVLLLLALLRDVLQRHDAERKLLQAKLRLEETVKQLEARAHSSAFTKLFAEELQLCAEPQEAYACTARAAKRLLPDAKGMLALINNSRQMAEVVSSWGEPTDFPFSFPPDACCALRSGRSRLHRADSSEIDCIHFSASVPDNYICLPLAAQGETLGILCVACPQDICHAELEANMNVLQEMGELSAMAIANLNLRVKLRDQSIRDSLTGLFNRHFMEISLERELRRAMRHNAQVAVFMLDVDHFKEFNDKYGHDAGDTVLREMAQMLRLCVRTEDVVCRYGGEEFLAILPEIDIATAWERAELIRQQVQTMKVTHRGELLKGITVSIGIAIYPEDGEEPDALVRFADRNLYRAKRSGRNQSILSNADALGA